MTATLTFLRKYICCCLGAGSDQSNTVLSHNRVNCSSCFGHIAKEDEDKDNVEQQNNEKEEGAVGGESQKDSECSSTQTIYEGRLLRPIASRSVWWKTPLTKEIST